jgi:hypothetical protein
LFAPAQATAITHCFNFVLGQEFVLAVNEKCQTNETKINHGQIEQK